ncbi:hypothetical protein [Adlercreutzia caecimuris]|uniref:hypothetical protein n=1 Tax=Adlercreutzia caecimuris TaxID=671266 RepID=UPI001C3F0541|nr:hypothetical protein [Adlercreutzia caecimuris]
MTLVNMLKLVKRYWAKVLAALIAFSLAGVAFGVAKAMVTGTEYSAEAIVTVSEPTDTIAADQLIPLIEAIGDNQASALDGGDEISIEGNVSSRTIDFSAFAPTAEESVQLANQIAQMTVDETRTQLDAMASKYRDAASVDQTFSGEGPKDLWGFMSIEEGRATAYETVLMVVNGAKDAKNELGLSTLAKFAVAGFVIGLLAVCCALVLVGALREPIQGKSDVEERIGLPVICDMSAPGPGERLWANIVLSGEAPPHSICLVPVHSASLTHLADDLQRAAARYPMNGSQERGIEVIVCESFEEDAAALFKARDADAAVLCATLWADSAKQMLDVVEELQLARANVVGVVLGGEDDYAK